MSETKQMKKLGYGLMRLPKVEGTEETIDVERVKGLVDKFMARGFTYFDTAYIYGDGESERAFREAVVKRYPRDSFTITDKIPMMNITREDQIAPIFDEMLERCGVEYLDYLWLHALGEVNYPKAVNTNAIDFVKQKKAEGKAKHIGFSYHGPADLLDEILTKHPEFEYVQLQINYLDWNDPAVQSGRCYDVCVKHGRPVIVMEPVKGGSLVNLPEEAEAMFRAADPSMSNASWAIRFVASHENVMVVLSGMSDEAQVEDNTSYMENFEPLTPEQIEMCLKAGDILRKEIAVPCTGCRYCTPTCPKHIAIPDYFAVYNTIHRFGRKAHGDIINYYNNLVQTHGTPADCIKCGICEKRCPQHLKIRDYLEEARSAFDSF